MGLFSGKKLGKFLEILEFLAPNRPFLAKITNFQGVFLGMNFSMLKCNLVYRAVIFEFRFWHLYFFVNFHDHFARFFYVVNLRGDNFGLTNPSPIATHYQDSKLFSDRNLLQWRFGHWSFISMNGKWKTHSGLHRVWPRAPSGCLLFQDWISLFRRFSRIVLHQESFRSMNLRL